jgi:flagellar L-ring protein precursor FlgH
MIRLVILALALSSVAEAKPKKKGLLGPQQTQELPAELLAPPMVEVTPPRPGSLWNEVAARRLLGLDGSARQVGDLVTIRISERTATNLGANTQTSRQSEQNAGITAMFGLENSLKDAFPKTGGSLTIGGSNNGRFVGQATTDRASTVETTLTCQVYGVSPNGDLYVAGYKEVTVNRERQVVTLRGIARPRDIGLDNTISADLMAQVKLEVVGAGVLADRQGPGIVSRALDHIWPF